MRLSVPDYAASKRFYTETLGLTVLAEHYRAERDSWKLDLGIGSHYALELFSFPNPPPRPAAPSAPKPAACAIWLLPWPMWPPNARNCKAWAWIAKPYAPMNTPAKISFLFKIPDKLPIEFYQE